MTLILADIQNAKDDEELFQRLSSALTERNHNDERFLQETVMSLRELEANEAASLFAAAWDIVRPYLSEIRDKDWNAEHPADYFDRIQSKIDPLNEDMWAICEACGELGLMQYWLTYARKYPERCVKEN